MFTVKDWIAYTDNNTTNKDVVLLMALPDGGGGFDLINMTKEEFFNIASNMVIKFNPSGSSDYIVFDDAQDVKLRYVDGSNYLFLDNLPRLIMSDDGSTNEQVELRNDASSSGLTVGGFSPTNGQKKGFVAIFTDGVAFSATLESTATADLTAEFSDARNENDPSTVNVQYREDRLYNTSTAITGNSTDIPGSYETIYKSVAQGGGIASHTFNMPAVAGGSGSAGNKVRLVIEGTITTVTMATPGAETIDDPFTAAGSSFQVREWVYDPAGVWERIL